MKKKVFFSIIMPVYNVEKYLEKAIKSVLEQTFYDFELIIIDDASNDNSKKIYIKYKEFCRIYRLEKNLGLSSVRNLGLEKSKGEYILFMDSDDWLENNALEILYNRIRKRKENVIIFGISEEYFNKKDQYIKSNIIKSEYYCSKNLIDIRKKIISLYENTLFRYAWNKIYKREFLENNNLKFKKINIVEDIIFNIEVFEYIDSILILDDVLIHYRRRVQGSLINKYYNDYWEVNKKVIDLEYNQYNRWNMISNIKKTLVRQYIKFVFLSIQMIFYKECKKSFNEKKDFIKDFVKKCSKEKFFKDITEKDLSGSLKYRVMYYIIKKRLCFIALLLGYIIYIMKKKCYLFWINIK